MTLVRVCRACVVLCAGVYITYARAAGAVHTILLVRVAMCAQRHSYKITCDDVSINHIVVVASLIVCLRKSSCRSPSSLRINNEMKDHNASKERLSFFTSLTKLIVMSALRNVTKSYATKLIIN
ncbi:hypothetical protein [Bacillus sp. 123MFChir2]|uniref:hypothetical protein n=1 Tax=Bacillus sp. 123MFChir2 TaxID=1169144 RepID=UPI0012DC572C|nr:hypothetical protein [Bacillus sp. 123MFChir2]